MSVSGLRSRVCSTTCSRGAAARSSSLVRPGLGKTTLLGFSEGRAQRFRVVRVTGIESEMEYPLAGLGALWSQLDTAAIDLPGPQAAAIEVALGHAPGPVPDQFLVALALLTALSEASKVQPILCAVDDVQWLDRGSRQALGFTSRRLHAEAVAMVYAVRRPHRVPELDGLDELTLEPLPDPVGAELLRRRAGLLDEAMIRRILRESRGNPLVLEEVSDGIVRTKLATGYLDFGEVTEWTPVERLYAGRIADLPADTRLLLLVAAADLTGDVGLLWSAAARPRDRRGRSRAGRVRRAAAHRRRGRLPASADPLDRVPGGPTQRPEAGAPRAGPLDRRPGRARSPQLAPGPGSHPTRREAGGRPGAVGRGARSVAEGLARRPCSCGAQPC